MYVPDTRQKYEIRDYVRLVLNTYFFKTNANEV